MSDIVERLRDYGLTLDENVIICDRHVVDESAETIERLTLERDEWKSMAAEFKSLTEQWEAKVDRLTSELSEARASGLAEGMEEAAQMVEVILTSAMTGETIVGRMLHKLDGDLIRSIAAAIRAAKEK